MIFNAINLASQIAYNPLGQGISYALYLILENARLNNQTKAQNIQFDTINGASKIIFARLGEIEFMMVDGLTGFQERVEHRIAVHETLSGKPAIQQIGGGLREITLSMTFHRFFSDPQARLEVLRAACEDGRVRKLSFGNGIYDGEFVILSANTTVLQSAPDGTIIHATSEVRIKEYASKEPLLVSRSKPKSKPKPKPRKVTPKLPARSFVPVVRGRVYPTEPIPVE